MCICMFYLVWMFCPFQVNAHSYKPAKKMNVKKERDKSKNKVRSPNQAENKSQILATRNNKALVLKKSLITFVVKQNVFPQVQYKRICLTWHYCSRWYTIHRALLRVPENIIDIPRFYYSPFIGQPEILQNPHFAHHKMLSNKAEALSILYQSR